MTAKLKLFSSFFFDKDRKSIKTIIKDIRKIKSQHKSIIHYFTCMAYKSEAGDVLDYISQEQYKRIDFLYMDRAKRHKILNDKGAFSLLMYEKGYPVAPFLALIKNNEIIDINKDIFKDKGYENIEVLLADYFKDGDSVFVKQVDSFAGQHVFRISSLEDFKALERTKDAVYIIEKKIIQHDAINKINSSCVISLRVYTVNKDNTTHVMPDCYFRMGMGDSVVDNASAGGIFIHYNLAKNKLGDAAYQKFKQGGKSFFTHPNTGYEFKGKSLPYPEKIISLLERAGAEFPEQELIGWDIAFTNDDPIIVEANDKPDIISMQIATKGILANPIYKEIFKEYL